MHLLFPSNILTCPCLPPPPARRTLAEFDVHKVNKKTKALVEAWPIDDDEGLAAVLAGHTSKDPVAFFATCLEREECTLMTPTPGRRGSGGGDGIQTLLAAVEIERGSAAAWEKNRILEVHLGIVAGTHGHEEATPTQIVLRVDAYGNAFEDDVSVRVINEALAEPLSKLGVKRENGTLYLIRGTSLKNLSIVVQDADLCFEAAPGRPPGTERLHLAIKVLKDTGRSGKLTKKDGWNPYGTGTGQGGDDYDAGDDDDADEDDTSKKHRLLALVKAAWRARGYQEDMALQTYHTQDLWKNKEAASKALQDKEVSTFPAIWPHGRQPTRSTDASSASSSSSSSSTAEAAAPPEPEMPMWMMQFKMMQQMMQPQLASPPTPAAPPLVASVSSPATRFQRLDELLSNGHINQEQHAAKKAKIQAELLDGI